MQDTIINKEVKRAYQPLKYNIKERYDTAYPLKRKLIRQELIPRYCSRSTFFDWLNIQKGTNRDIGGEALQKFSVLFNVPIEMLFNK